MKVNRSISQVLVLRRLCRNTAMSALDLREFVKHFYPRAAPAFYQMMNRMVEEGLVERCKFRPAQKTKIALAGYRITAAGIEEDRLISEALVSATEGV